MQDCKRSEDIAIASGGTSGVRMLSTGDLSNRDRASGGPSGSGDKFLGCKSDGDPGWKTFWKGWVSTQTLLQGST